MNDSKLKERGHDLFGDPIAPVVDLVAKVQRLQDLALARGLGAAQSNQTPICDLSEPLGSELPAVIGDGHLRMPNWQDHERGLPADLVRSALFKPRNRNQKRQWLQQEEIFCTGDLKLFYSGVDLRCDDELLLMGILHFIRARADDFVARFTSAELLAQIGKEDGGSNYRWLDKGISYLKATELQFVYKKNGRLRLSLIESGADQLVSGNQNREWALRIPPEMVRLFGNDYYPRINLPLYKQIKSNIGKTLLVFFSRHRQPYDHRIETLQKKCGLTSDLKSFKQNLQKALDELVRTGFLVRFEITPGGLVKVWRA